MCMMCAGATHDDVIHRVNPQNLAGEWFAQWHPIARAAGHGTTSLGAVQVRINEVGACDGCVRRQRALERRCMVDQLAHDHHPG